MHAFSVGGITPLTSTDFPGCLSAVVFLQGCPWSCRYCHNPHLIPANGETEMTWSDVKKLLSRRRGLLDAVVFSGGEPTLQSGIVEAAVEVREMGFRLGLHTGGAYPARFEKLLPLLDWVGMDMKASFENYAEITGRAGSGEKARESAGILLKSKVPYEFRTTIHPLLHSPEELLRMARHLSSMGAKHWVIQEFRARGCADEALRDHNATSPLSDLMQDQFKGMFETFSVRRS